MTALDSPSALLRRAATRVEELAAAATPGPWVSVESYFEEWLVDSPSSNIANESSCGGIEKGDAEWMALAGPQVAAPLAAWLRAEADLAEVVDRRPGPIADMTGMGSTSLAPFDSPALTLARVLLHEEAS